MARYPKVSPGQELIFSAGLHNDTVDLIEAAERVPVDRGRRPSNPAQGTVVWIRNNSGEDRARWDCMALDLGGLDTVLRFAIITGAESVIFNAVAADPNKEAVILQEPIPAGKFGRAVVFGYTLAKVYGGSGERASPSANHYLVPSGVGSVRLLAAPPTAAVVGLVPCLVGFGAPASILAMTPTGGIRPRAPATGSPPYTFYGAPCTLVTEFGAVMSPTRMEAVYNMTSITIPGNSLIQAKRIYTRYFVDVDNC